MAADEGRTVDADLVRRLQSVLNGTVELASEAKAENLMEPARGSTAEREQAEGFTAGRYQPLYEAYSMSEVRLVAAAGHLAAISGMLQQGSNRVYAVSASARTALESSARVAWLLHPTIDTRTRGLRSIAELIYTFREESKMPLPDFKKKAAASIENLIEGSKAAGLQPVFDRRGISHFGEARPDATSVIGLEAGIKGEVVYRDLSGMAHGNLTAHVRLTEPVPSDEQLGVAPRNPDMTVRQAMPPIRLAPQLRIVWLAYMKALDYKHTLYGWKRDWYKAWMIEAGREFGSIAWESTPPDARTKGAVPTE